MGKAINLIGQKFNRLTVIKRAQNSRGRKARWLCKCDCGNYNVVDSYDLRSGHTKSCGCFAKEELVNKNLKHGHSCRDNISPTFYTWYSMIQRCYYNKNDSYKYYGGRGIKVCEKWLKFEGFLQDMGERPPGKTLDRKDNNSDYCKENCKWSTPKEQSIHRSTSRLITIGNQTKCLKDWCLIKDISYDLIWRRIKKNNLNIDDIVKILSDMDIQMQFKTLDGRIIKVQLNKKVLCRNIDHRSIGQENLSILLKTIYGPVEIFEEFIIPGEKLSLDFFIPKRSIAFEFNGKQHYKLNNFFHKSRQNFLLQKDRDERKLQWCKINHITLIEIQDNNITLKKLMDLVVDQIRKQNNC